MVFLFNFNFEILVTVQNCLSKQRSLGKIKGEFTVAFWEIGQAVNFEKVSGAWGDEVRGPLGH